MRARKPGSRVTSELNVTPMIDVVLVLLIIFMVVTPRKDMEQPVVVTAEGASESKPAAPPDVLLLRIDDDGTWRMGARAFTAAELKPALRDALARRPDKVVFLDVAPEAVFEKMVDAMDVAREAGAQHVGLVKPQ